MRSRHLALPIVGRRAPELRLRDAAGKVFTLAPFDGQPVVLAILESWSTRGDAPGASATPAIMEAIRAELRGLGAVLVALTADALWCFRPDDEMQVFAARAELDAGDVEALRASFGIGPERGRTAGGVFGLFVIDGRQTLSFTHVAPIDEVVAGAGSEDSGAEVLLAALSAAGRALVTRRREPVLVSRRDLVTTSLVAGFALVLLDACKAPAPPSLEAPPVPSAGPSLPAPPGAIAGEVDVTLDVNGERRVVRIDPRVSLLDALRERMGLPGTKKGCDHGQCGACTVLVDGRRVLGCLTLAMATQGAAITTIEGLAKGGDLHPMQAAFVVEDALQCGYCTPGQILSAVGLLAEGGADDDEAIRQGMSGNICRCGAYANIVAAVRRVRQEGTGRHA